MFEITKYFLPAACFLLITVFFMLLPDLRICKLGGGARRMDRADALVVAGVTIVYAVARPRALSEWKTRPRSSGLTRTAARRQS